MVMFLLRRIAQGVLVMLMVTIVVYFLFFHGDPQAVARRIAGREATPDVVKRVYDNLGLNQPFFEQYWHFLTHLVHGNLGYDYYNGVPVTSVLKQAVPITFSLVLGAAIIWLFIGVATGVYSSVRAHSTIDRALTGIALVFYSCLLYTSPSPRDRQKSR